MGIDQLTFADRAFSLYVVAAISIVEILPLLGE